MFMTSTTKKPKAYSYLRFSSSEQMKGDSLRRQTEISQRYADQHNLDLDQKLTFQDLGVSAYRGQNVEEGELGSFIKAVEQGHVERGSYLLVESLDRMSRQNPFAAFTHFSAILNMGVNVVTLHDGKTYTAEDGSMAFEDILVSLVSMQRAHEESATKAKRHLAMWEGKREKAENGIKITALCPGWLTLDKQANTFRVDEERALLVRRVFDMYLDGLGQGKIAETLNSEGTPPFSKRSNGWHPTYIHKVLTNTATIGEYQPHRADRSSGKKKRVPVGDPIKEYYPAVVDEKVFLKAQQMRKSKRHATGRSTTQYANLFVGIAKCGSCGGTMIYESKGAGYEYLLCSEARRKFNCKRHTWKNQQAKAHIMMNLAELDCRSLFPDVYGKTQDAVAEIKGDILVKEAELEKVATRLDAAMDLLLDRPESEALRAKMDALESDGNALRDELKALKESLDSNRERAITAHQDYDDFHDSMAQFLEIERHGNQEAKVTARRRLHQLLKRIIDKIVFTPAGNDQDDLHGIIEITFKGVEDYFRRIKVEKGQRCSRGYRVVDGEEHEEVYMGEDTDWPPHGAIITAGFLMD